MSMRSHRRSLIVLVLAASALAALPAASFATHSWGGYHWARTANPFNLKLGDNVSATWDPYLATTSSDWSQSTVLNTNVVAGQSTKRCRPTSGRVEVCSSTYGQNGWLGLAQIWLSSGHISQGAVKVNDTYFNMPQYNNSAERNHVMCQEVGHTIGLGHTSEDGSSQGTCMDYSQSLSSQHPNQHDYDQLGIIYAHLDSFNSAKALREMPPAMRDIDFEGIGQWGRMVYLSKDGRESIHVLDFGHGYKVVTFVTWADLSE